MKIISLTSESQRRASRQSQPPDFMLPFDTGVPVITEDYVIVKDVRQRQASGEEVVEVIFWLADERFQRLVPVFKPLQWFDHGLEKMAAFQSSEAVMNEIHKLKNAAAQKSVDNDCYGVSPVKVYNKYIV